MLVGIPGGNKRCHIYISQVALFLSAALNSLANLCNFIKCLRVLTSCDYDVWRGSRIYFVSSLKIEFNCMIFEYSEEVLKKLYLYDPCLIYMLFTLFLLYHSNLTYSLLLHDLTHHSLSRSPNSLHSLSKSLDLFGVTHSPPFSLAPQPPQLVTLSLTAASSHSLPSPHQKKVKGEIEQLGGGQIRPQPAINITPWLPTPSSKGGPLSPQWTCSHARRGEGAFCFFLAQRPSCHAMDRPSSTPTNAMDRARSPPQGHLFTHLLLWLAALLTLTFSPSLSSQVKTSMCTFSSLPSSRSMLFMLVGLGLLFVDDVDVFCCCLRVLVHLFA
jgi:hypothetical protein